MKKHKHQDSQDCEAETSQVNPAVHADEFSDKISDQDPDQADENNEVRADSDSGQ